MQQIRSTTNYTKVDSYSALIFAKYFQNKNDFINLICVNSKFKETTEKFRYNPIPITSLKLFPKIQTQHLYSKKDKKIRRKQIIKYEYWYSINYDEYFINKKKEKNEIKCHHIVYSIKDKKAYGEIIPDEVTIIGDMCFNNSTSLQSLGLPTTITKLGCGCFSSSPQLTSIKLPKNLISLNNSCFCGCSSLHSIILPPVIKELGDFSFSYCSLTSIDLPSTLTKLGVGCFSCCYNLSSITLPESISSIDIECFESCYRVTSIHLPSTLISLGDQCFGRCKSLTLINLPSTIKSFGKSCFFRCDKLNKVINVPNYCFDYPEDEEEYN
ncbi:Leucine rich repeat containing protein BspA family protein [Entamoeba marina]